ncbi:hypothetical protein BDR07DRAFT_78558 [Suillus spraguei]|nr:hypothetical protein BDR07DRAFT_78558 [Suillus spraguei]
MSSPFAVPASASFAVIVVPDSVVTLIDIAISDPSVQVPVAVLSTTVSSSPVISGLCHSIVTVAFSLPIAITVTLSPRVIIIRIPPSTIPPTTLASAPCLRRRRNPPQNSRTPLLAFLPATLLTHKRYAPFFVPLRFFLLLPSSSTSSTFVRIQQCIKVSFATSQLQGSAALLDDTSHISIVSRIHYSFAQL